MIKDIKTFIYGFIATLFCWSCIIIGGFAVYLAFALGVDEVMSSPIWVIALFFGVAVGVAGIHGFYFFLVEEQLMPDYFGALEDR
jgi:hypothetical protein